MPRMPATKAKTETIFELFSAVHAPPLMRKFGLHLLQEVAVAEMAQLVFWGSLVMHELLLSRMNPSLQSLHVFEASQALQLLVVHAKPIH